MSATAAELDARDPLAHFAREFYKPPGQIYLDGNSLGLMCKPAETALLEAIESWRSRAILGWTDGPSPWFSLARRVAALLAPILGCDAGDVMLGESTTVNLHQILATFHEAYFAILIDEWSFPSDRYAIESHLRLRGQDPKTDLIVVRDREELIAESAIMDAMDSSVAMAVLPSVVYRSGQLLNMADLTAKAREKGVLIAWDCSHSAGVIPHKLREDDIDLAFGCSYKYLNGGPGSPAFLYVHPRLRDRLPGLAGWFGSDPTRQFQMSDQFQGASDAGRYMIGTPHVLSMAPLLGSLELINRAGIDAIRAKSIAITTYLYTELAKFSWWGEWMVGPHHSANRGGHVTVEEYHADKVTLALRKRGLIVDHRPPDLIRFAPSPLSTSFEECELALQILLHVRQTEAHLDEGLTNALVT